MVKTASHRPDRKSMKPRSLFVKTALCVAVTSGATPPQAFAAPLALSTAPAGTDHKPPAPNVIVSVDNSGSAGSAGMKALRHAFAATFAGTRLPDGSIRLAWQAMDGTSPSAMRVLDSTHRKDLAHWINGLKSQGNMHARRMLLQAGEYLKRPIDIDSAWASVPGRTREPVLACRRAYHIVLSSGGWKEPDSSDERRGGDVDGTWAQLPDGVQYDPASPSSAIYRGAPPQASTLSDLAFHYWMTDLQPTLADKVKPLQTEGDPERFTSEGVTRNIEPYWNPRNDPATWQHLNTYTVGFDEAAKWRAAPAFGTDTWTGGDYDALVTGTRSWPDPIAGGAEGERNTELWHMAINSRGQFMPAPDGGSLSIALQRLLDQIISERFLPVTSLSLSSRSIQQDSALFAASYDPATWSGQVTGYRIKAGTAEVDPSGLWGTDKASRANTTATLMDARDASWPQSRMVLSGRTTSKTGAAVGISWEWANLSRDSQLALQTVGGAFDPRSTAEQTAKDRMAYLRGDRSKEQSRAPAGIFRNRVSRHGDIVNSKIWYLAGKPSSAYMQEDYAGFRNARGARPSMLYVGANDGMLHGFDAATGEERLAYVPEGLHEKLVELTRPSYSHAYYVDGSPLTGDLYLGTPGSKDPTRWRTYLAGFLGAGGKGYFVLDVTDPGAFSTADATSLVIADKTAAISMDADVGHILSDPVTEAGDPSLSRQITQMNDGRWALVMGNGYNSKNEKAVLLIQYLDGAKELIKIAAYKSGVGGNGLSAPRLIDLNGDRIADVAYAGDLLGNLWKFDLSAATSKEWRVAFSGTPLFVATDATPAAARQPITSAPVWKAHPNGGLMLAFGTGRDLTVADRSDIQKQTVYGIRDDTPITRDKAINPLTGTGTVTLGSTGAVTGGRSQLVEQTVGGGVSSAPSAGSADAFWTISSNPVAYAGTDAKKGWFLDLPATRERVLRNPGWFDGDLIDISSTVPAEGADAGTETCDPHVAGAKGYRTILDIVNGAAPKSQIYAAVPAPQAESASRVYTSASSVGIRSRTVELGVAPPGMRAAPPAALLGKVMKRPSWRQLQ